MHATAAAETVGAEQTLDAVSDHDAKRDEGTIPARYLGAEQTLDAISDLITDGRAGFFIRFLPCDVALALHGDAGGGGAEGGAGGWAARQMRAALALTSERGGGEGGGGGLGSF